MPKKPPTPEQLPDLLDPIIDEIARRNLHPVPGKTDWAGRGALILFVVRKHYYDSTIAADLVNKAADRMCRKEQDSEPRVELRKSVIRLHHVRDMLMTQLSTPRVKIEYDIRPALDEKGNIRRYLRKSGKHKKGEIILEEIPKKRTVDEVIAVQLYDKLLAVEALLAKLQGLEDSAGATSRLQEMIKHLEEAAKGAMKQVENGDGDGSGEVTEVTTDTTLSVAQRIRKMNPRALMKKHPHVGSAPIKQLRPPPEASTPIEGELVSAQTIAGPPPDATGEPIG